MSKRKDLQIFIENFGKLEPIEAIGVFKILGISVTEDLTDEQFMEQVLDRFLMLNRKNRRTLTKIVRAGGRKE